ncbi:serine/threonine-protein kinase [Ornithinimicrobium sp. Y1694]|uniref:serine/threonine-protein kinase n=1 Tax=Ornithinimicrobium sp. Y1694 TaxID=3418590 RepID=UPI003CEAE17B
MTTELPRTPGADETRPVPVGDPRRLGVYDLHERLGEGGMGVVWRATDARHPDRDVAIKVLRQHIAHDDQARERLRREVETLARVHHPRVAAVIDADVDGSAPYIVTEYVPGPPLDTIVADRGPLRGEALLRLGRGLGEALHAIHGAGIVHRDLKPGNVLMMGSGEVLDPVVIDFGIAQVADDVRMTMTGMVMGTPGYLSPEVVEGGEVTEATDWWGWAATLAYAASGQPPFGRGPLTVVLDRVLRGRLHLEGVDPQLAPLLQAALDPDPIRRPTEAQVLDGLERYARREDVTGALPLWMVHDLDHTRMHDEPTATRVAPVRSPVRERGADWRDASGGPGAGGGWAAPPAPVREPQWREPQPVPGDRYPDSYPVREEGRGTSPTGGATPYPMGPQGGVDPRIGRSARTGSLAALLVAFVGLATVAPLLAWGLYAVWGIAARTVDRSLTSLVLRRHEAGRRPSDVPMAVLASPFHLLSAAVGTFFGLLLPLGLAIMVAVVLSGFVTSTELMYDVTATHPIAIGIGSLIGAIVGWWGLASTSLRRGSRTLLRGTVRSGAPSAVLATVLVVGGGALAVWTVLQGGSVSWWPLSADFDPREWAPWLP